MRLVASCATTKRVPPPAAPRRPVVPRSAALRGQLEVGDHDQVVGHRAAVVGQRVGVHPVDVQVAAARVPLLQRAALVEPDQGEVDGGDLPAALGQPEGVAALAGGEVDAPARRQVGQLRGDELVGRRGPDQLAAAYLSSQARASMGRG